MSTTATPKPRWRPEQVADLRRLLRAGESSRRIAHRVGKTALAVKSMTRHLGLKSAYRRWWSDADRAVLRDRAAAGVPLGTVARELGRSRAAVAAEAAKLGLARPRPSLASGPLQERLRELAAGGATAGEIAAALGVGGKCVRKWARRLGLAVTRRPPPSGPRVWTAARDRGLLALHPLGADEAARRLGVTAFAVYHRARLLGRPFRRADAWTADEVRHLFALHRTVPEQEIADRLGRTLDAVRQKVSEVGLGRVPLTDVTARPPDNRALAARYGLPPDATPREVQIVASLAVHGVRTAADLSRDCGRTTCGGYLARLRSRGLVASVPCGPPPARAYVLTPLALDLLAAAPPEATPC